MSHHYYVLRLEDSRQFLCDFRDQDFDCPQWYPNSSKERRYRFASVAKAREFRASLGLRGDAGFADRDIRVVKITVLSPGERVAVRIADWIRGEWMSAAGPDDTAMAIADAVERGDWRAE